MVFFFVFVFFILDTKYLTGTNPHSILLVFVWILYLIQGVADVQEVGVARIG